MGKYIPFIKTINIYARKLCDRSRIKNFERHYGVHFRSLRRSRRFMIFLFISLFSTLYFMFKFSPTSNRPSHFTAELDNCMLKNLDKYQYDINLMNSVFTESHNFKTNYMKNSNDDDPAAETSLNHQTDEKFYIPYTGNGYIGLSIQSNEGLFVSYHKSLSLKIFHNPLVQVYSENYPKKETSVTEFKRGIVHLIQCYQKNKECISVENTLYAHRTRPSLLIEEVILNNPTKEPITFDILQMGEKNWNNSKSRTEIIDGEEFLITSGIVDVTIDGKLKHLCVSIGTLRLPITLLLKEHEFFQKYTIMTVVKYSSTLLNGKSENLDPILIDLENNVVKEIKSALLIGYKALKQEHENAWRSIWNSGFGISNSLATGAMNGNQLNASIYYSLTNNRAPLFEVTKLPTNSSNAVQFSTERCYEGFSTLHAIKLWKLPRNEIEVSDSNLLWLLTLQKHGCGSLLELGASGILQAIVLSLGGFKFTHHHLDLNLNPRQLHRDYQFRNINYANTSLISVDVEVGYDNHAVLYVTLNELMNPEKRFYACDAGCLDTPVELKLHDRQEFPVKLTNPITAILYISSDKNHINELKHALHVQEIDIAPPQDVNSIAIHKHGHHMAGFTALFWTIFVSLIIIFHLFLIKLVYRELCAGSADTSSYETNTSKKYRYARTV